MLLKINKPFFDIKWVDLCRSSTPFPQEVPTPYGWQDRIRSQNSKSVCSTYSRELPKKQTKNSRFALKRSEKCLPQLLSRRSENDECKRGQIPCAGAPGSCCNEKQNSWETVGPKCKEKGPGCLFAFRSNPSSCWCILSLAMEWVFCT